MKTYNIPIFVPHKGCPFDCVFCNQRRITGMITETKKEDVNHIIEEHLKTLPKDNRYVEVAFFGGSFTGIEFKTQRELLSAAYEYVKRGDIDGIRLSTRPDYISNEILDLLSEYGVTTIELGVQSLDEVVLKASNRGHSEDTVIDAVNLIKKYEFKIGLQMMTGLPEDNDERSITTAKKIIDLKPDFVRIYPTLVIKDTFLEKMYLEGKYTPQTLEDAVRLCKQLLILFNEWNIPVIRIALAVTEEISPDGSVVAGPFHSAFRELVEAEIYYDKLEKLIKQGHSKFLVNNKEISKAVGNKRSNVIKAKQSFDVDIKIIGDKDIEKGSIKIV